MTKLYGKFVVVMISLFAIACLFVGCGNVDNSAETVPSVTVYADSQIDGNYGFPYQELTVSADTAESYGYEDQVSEDTAVSALDVLVAMHEVEYDDAFTTDTCNDYFVVNDGWISKAFENDTTSWSVIVNGEAAHSDVTSEYGGFESLMINQTEVSDDDVVEVISYQDMENYTDNELWLLQDDTRISQLSLTAGAETTLTVKGYSFAYYGAYGTEEISSQYLMPMEGAQLAILNEDGSLSVMEGVASDVDGMVTFQIDEAGTYTVVAFMPEDTGMIAFYSALTVTVVE
jgi:hypothetical protein